MIKYSLIHQEIKPFVAECSNNGKDAKLCPEKFGIIGEHLSDYEDIVIYLVSNVSQFSYSYFGYKHSDYQHNF